MGRLLGCLLCCLWYWPLAFADVQTQQEFETEARAAIKDFQGQLKAALLSAMKTSGPVDAIAVCKDIAPALATQLSAQYGLEIRRTSLKVRNQDNQADAWEAAVLNQLQSRLDAGTSFQKLVFSEQVISTNGSQWRMMKAIPTDKVCLSCHGNKIAKPIQAKLDELYPKDQATGFKLGEIRGAFSVKQRSSAPR